MKPITAVIDSVNISSSKMESYFFNNENYSIETVKSIGVFEPDRWVQEFKKSLTRNIVEAKILHTSTGLMLPIKRHSRSQNMQVIEFAGLHGYTEKSTLLSELLSDLMELIKHEYIVRLDVAIDFKGKIPNKVIKKLCEDREPFRFWNTTYYKSKSEKKQNNRLNIKTYSKSNKEKLGEEINRLEFVFLRDYLKKLQVKDIEKSFKKMEKTIKRFSGLEVQISFL
ncbi:hypothetical protein [Sulfurimonas sp.]|uniref:hypothetical protein n=1 Tax=Sulfurimonas sp. TaxID=2022749 RepID=UPI002625E04E|nr:hypothetical protein [Sulfurimonas sp.]